MCKRLFKVKNENSKNDKIHELHKSLLLKCRELPTQTKLNKSPPQEKQISHEHVHIQNSDNITLRKIY